MTAIVLTITAAGRARLVDAALPGTAALRIAQAGLSATAFVADAGMVAMPGEFGRISTVAGAVVDAATISLVIRDDTLAAYALRGFALYLSDGTLFALYGQPAPILEKASGSTALLAVDVRFVDIVDPNLTFVEAGFTNPPATTEVIGVIELATAAEAAGGVDAVRAITPATLRSVLNARFGINAASAFVRTLLDAASAAALRGLLGLGTAATKNEGSGSGLNADLLRGLPPSTLPIASAGGPWGSVPVINNAGVTDIGHAIDFHSAPNDPGDYGARLAQSGANLFINGNQVWTAGNDGAGSGLDADLLDGRDAASFANVAHSHGAAEIAGAFLTTLAVNGGVDLPGGTQLRWGRLRGSFTGEPSAAVVFDPPFTNDCLNITGTVFITAPTSSNRDHWLQVAGEPTRLGATLQFQSDGGTTSNGLNYFAIGY